MSKTNEEEISLFAIGSPCAREHVGKKAETETKISNTGRRKAKDNDDALQRLNYLYQAANYMALAGARSGKSAQGSNPNSGACAKNGVGMSRYYCRQLKFLAERSVSRVDPSVKRTICKRCHVALFPGVTANYCAVEESQFLKQPEGNLVGVRRLVIECKACASKKTILCNPNYKQKEQQVI